MTEEVSSHKDSMDKSPLEMNCENAILFVRDHVQQHAALQDMDFPDFSPLTNFAFLDKVSQLLLTPQLTECVGIAFHPILPELVGRWAGVEVERTEDVACALGRLVYLDPRLKRYAQELLLERPSFLRSIAHLTPTTISSTTWDSISTDSLRENLLAALRLSIYSRSIFLRFLTPLPLLSLLQHPDLSIRYLAIELLSISLGLADAARIDWQAQYLGPPDHEFYAPWEGRSIDYGVLLIFESERVYKANKTIRAREYFRESDGGRKFAPEDLGRWTGVVAGVLIPRFNETIPVSGKLVMTDNTKVNLRNIARIIVAEKPLLLQSIPGAGKSFLIDEIAKLFGRFDDVVRITLTDQTDAKILLGTYVTSTPGSFTWRAGILTTAVKEGKWIVIEDIERAGNDVLSVLLPLLEGRPLELNGRGTIEMGKGGQIIATTRLYSGTKSAQIENMLGIQRWSRVTVIPPTDNDLLDIITNLLLPQISFIAPVLLQVYISLREIQQTTPLLTKTSRKLSPRDLLKWTKRTSSLCKHVHGETIPRETWDDIFLEAIDCFAAMHPHLPARHLIIETIGKQMGFPSERVDLYLTSHSPILTSHSQTLQIGRCTLPKLPGSARRSPRPFAYTTHARKLVEQLSVAIAHQEPLLLVGETGTGKTTVVQHLADLVHQRLVVVNVSQQTESGDLLGGFKPLEARTRGWQIKDMFEGLFERTFSVKRNEVFLTRVGKCFSGQKWGEFVKLLKEAIGKAETRFNAPSSVEEGGTAKKRRRVDTDLKPQWSNFANAVQSFELQISSGKGKSHAFSFVEGSLVKALKRGDWLLLDEINLAASETLESISSLLRENPSITLPETGDLTPLTPHPHFRLFAAMNPATDVGKRDLPPALRSQFTELYVPSPDESLADLILIIKQYIGHLCVGDERATSDVARLYLKIKGVAEAHEVVDGTGAKPHFSMRTLTRTLMFVGDCAGMYGLRRALYEGFCMSFSTMLEVSSRERVVAMIAEGIYPNATRNLRFVLRTVPKRPAEGEVIQLGHYWIEMGEEATQENPGYIVKPDTSVERNLHNLVRASLTRRYPILLQGPTSSGKTSMIEHLAKLTGHKFLRINNHEHTSLDEYLGTYISTSTGDFIFQEGILVQALRRGHWIVLDELNLAPSDVLEALNRLLDDNRELLIPETQEVITPHPHFMLFATQNPAGLYGGRKVLSRAFRNRFLELEFDDIPEHELEEILCLRCQIPPSYGAKIVEVYKQLSMQRQSTRLFEQRNSFATLRDLFRWAQREAVGYQQLAENGYMLLAERVRRVEERVVVKQVIEKVMKVKIDEPSLYDLTKLDPQWTRGAGLIWTKAMRRLYILVSQALVNNEPVLLVGETGSGKTTVCQVLAERMGKELHVINAHQNTETGDIIGGQRPYRDRVRYQGQLVTELRTFFSDRPETSEMALEDLADEFSKLDVDRLLASSETPDVVSASIDKIRDTFNRQKILFEWVDGALVQAMKQGEPFLLDEISLADDSVLERLNSVLETSRSIVLAEKGGDEVHVTASDGFQFFATMNPGGDYGKKELSPALRNRFTEIWVPAVDDRDDLIQIVRAALTAEVGECDVIVDFAEWFTKRIASAGTTISIRDILAWVNMVNATYQSLETSLALFHGAMMVYVDGIGATAGTEFLDIPKEKLACVSHLSSLLGEDFTPEYQSPVLFTETESGITIGHFDVPRGNYERQGQYFSFESPTTAANGMKVLRAMQLPKSILLEGAPGIGKTTLIAAIAAASHHPLVRINLSDQTDLMDLFGSDVPVDGGSGGEFAWRDAPFLRAMQNGDWVLLDELNLASQSVLEGLNACLDHRGTAYIPELNRSFTRHPDFRIFAAQNPHAQGGGRKGLPKSFVNRFSVVYVETLTVEDMVIIASKVFASIDKELIRKLITFIVSIQNDANSHAPFASLGRPWEFNLRDALRWLELVQYRGLDHGKRPESYEEGRALADYLPLVISQRLRSITDKKHLDEAFERQIGRLGSLSSTYALGKDTVQVGSAVVNRRITTASAVPFSATIIRRSKAMESLTTCVERCWPCLLVGPSGAGKTSMIRALASVVGASCQEFSMNSDTDATDIIGGYEQRDVNRQVRQVADRLRTLLIDSLITVSEPSEYDIYGRALTCLSSESYTNESTSELRSLVDGQIGPIAEMISQLIDLVGELAHDDGSGKFQWYDGVLIDALREGSWIILDNANLCNPSVLDRLNSLLEPDGSLVLHEFTNADGEPKLVRPHKNFRLFLTMDPRYGELSRAMRNRAVEIFVESVPSDRIFDGKSRNRPTLIEDSQIDRYVTSESNFGLVTETLSLFRVEESDISVHGRKFAQQLLEYAPIQALPFLGRWIRSSEATGGSYRVGLKDAFEVVSTGPVGKDFVTVLHEICAHLELSHPFADSQSLLPILNDHLRLNLQDARWGIQHDIAMRFSDMRNALSEIELEATKRGKGESRALIRASQVSRKAADFNDPAVAALSLLKNIYDAFRKWMLSPSYKDDRNGEYPLLEELTRLWFDMACLLSEDPTDPSYYTIFREALERWVQRSGQALKGFVYHIRPELDNLSTLVTLSTGFSMSVIWEAVHPIVPSTLEQWNSYDQLLALISDFESKVGNQIDHVNEMVTIKSSFLEAVTAMLMAPQSKQIPFWGDLTRLRDADLGYAEVVAEGGLSSAEESIRGAFRSLHDLAQIHHSRTADKGILRNVLIPLSHFGGQPLLRSCLRFNSMDNPIINSLRMSLLSSETLQQITGMTLFKQCVDISDAAASTRNRDSDRSGRVMQLFGQMLAKCTDVVTSSTWNSLLSNVQQDIKQLLQLKVQSSAGDKGYRELRQLSQLFSSALEVPFPHGSNGTVAGLPKSHRLEIPFQELQRSVKATIRDPNQDVEGEIAEYGRVAEAFIGFALAFIALYVPDKPFDPAAAAIVERKRANLLEADLTMSVDTRTHIEQHLRGSNQSCRLTADIDKLEQARTATNASSALKVYRPPLSQIPQIQQDLNQLLQLTVKSQRLPTILSEALTARSELENLINTLERLASRLEINYPYYRDSLAFTVGCISRLVFGLRLRLDVDLLNAEQTDQSHVTVKSILSISELTLPMTDVRYLRDRDSISRYEGSTTEFNLYTLERHVFANSNAFPLMLHVEIISLVLDQCYKQWRITKERKKIEETAKTSIYKRKDEDYELDQAIAEYFPDQVLENDIHEIRSQAAEEETALAIFQLHQKLFAGSSGSAEKLDVRNVLERGLRLVSKCSDAFLSDALLLTSLPAHILSLASTLGTQTRFDLNQYDFYRSSNIQEVRLFLHIVSTVQTDTRRFLEAWPEHANLHDIAQLCDKIWDLPAAAPLSRVLPFVERLYSLVDQWQGVASRDYSLANPHNQIKDTIVRWRRLELSSWKTLLADETRRHRQSVSTWWFDIYELLIYNLRAECMGDLSDYLVKAVAGLNDFITAATLGDFGDRLRMLLSFGAHAHLESNKHPALEHVSQACYHLHRMFRLYSSEVEKTVADQKTTLEKEIAETVQLASWRDTSVFALTESARRSHHRLYKTVRKYRDLLSQPVAPILRRGADVDLKIAGTILSDTPILFRSNIQQDIVLRSVAYCEETGCWSAQSRLFLDPIPLSTSIRNIFARCDALFSELPLSAAEFVTDIESLRTQTPSTLTDENEKQVKFLRTQKKRVLAQTMKSLREWGIASKTADQNLTSSTDANRMLSAAVWKEQLVDSIQSRIDERFYRIVDLLPRLRATGAEHSPDISDAEFHRAHGYLESLVDGLFEQRRLLAEFDINVCALKTAFGNTFSLLVNQIKSTENVRFAVTESSRSHVESLSTMVRRLSATLAASIDVLEAHGKLDVDANLSVPIAYLQGLESHCQSWSARINSIPSNDNVIFADGVDCCNGIKAWFSEVADGCYDIVSKRQGISYALKPILDLITESHRISELSFTPLTSDSLNISTFQRAAETLGSTALVASQELSKLLDQPAPATYPRINAMHKTAVKHLNHINILTKLNSTHRSSISLLSSQDGLRRVLAVYNSLLPVLEQYVNGCEQVQHQLLRFHDEFSQMTHVLMLSFHTLATKGYCSPQRAEKETGQSGVDGVGLGEGEGETDISNEIKGDEDLGDLAQQDAAEANESKADDDQNGVDMEDDFEGALEDGPEREEKEEDEEDEEGEEMDEGTGNVDDADPSAVDEQFWEDQAKQPPDTGDQKETQGKKEQEGQNGEMIANNKDKESKETKEDTEEETQENGEENDGSDVEESGIQNREEDTRMPEAEPLDIADDLDLNQPDGEAKAESIFSDEDMDMDDMAGEEIEENVVSDGEIEKDGEEKMDFDNDGENGKDEKMDEEPVETENVDRSEYQGEDVAASDAIGKGGDIATTEETQKGSSDNVAKQDKSDSANQPSTQPQDGANGDGEEQQEAKADKDKSTESSQRQDTAASNPFRKLGDMLEQWRRDLQNIQDVADDTQPEQKTVGQEDPEYAYVGEEQQFDTQGLGPAAPDQVQPLDMSMAIDEDKSDPPPEVPTQNESAADASQSQGMQVDGTLPPSTFGATIGDRSTDPDRMDIDQFETPTLDEPPLPIPLDPEINDSLHIASTLTEEARLIWQQHDRSTHDLSLSLCEQLRLILEPTQATKMRGDFRTGKRLNMRRIIPYIASDYKKDKIWLRRTKPSKRQYQVLLAMDDSKSMSDSKSVKLAFDTLALTAKALTQLEVGQISIVRFGAEVDVVHGFEEMFTQESGGKVVGEFKFDQERTDVCRLAKRSIELFEVARTQQDARSVVGGELWQLELIISDGICEDHDTIRRLVRQAFEAKIMMIFVILDAIHPERKDSITDIKSYSFEQGENGQTLKETKYLDSFPFSYYVIVRDVRELPSVLASALRQWFAEVAER